MQLILFIWFIFYNSTCFGRSPRPSSGVIFFLQTVVAATGVCYRYGVDKSRIGVIGSVCIRPGSIDVDGLAIYWTGDYTHTTNNPYTGFIHPVPTTHTSGCHYTL